MLVNQLNRMMQAHQLRPVALTYCFCYCKESMQFPSVSCSYSSWKFCFTSLLLVCLCFHMWPICYIIHKVYMILHTKSIYFYYIGIAFRLTDLYQIETSLPSVVGLKFSFLSVYLFSSVFLFCYSYVSCSLFSSISFYIFILFSLFSLSSNFFIRWAFPFFVLISLSLLFLGAFAKLRKVTTSFVMSVCPSA
jgi:hypothetical protein